MAKFNKEKALEIISSGDQDDIQDLIDHLDELLNEKQYGLIWEKGGDDEDSPFEPQQVIVDFQNNVPYPKLCPELSTRSDKADGNLLLEGDNYIWLRILEQTHQGKIDLCYIDVPYNTGAENGEGGLKYNDKFVGADDVFKHSKWLDIINERLTIARNLLAEDGVIFISVDDREQAALKLLCDEIFGVENFIATIVVSSNSSKNNARYVGVMHEYLICYAKDESNLDTTWKVKKNNIDEFVKRAKQLVKRGLSPDTIHKELLELVKYPRFYDFDHYTYADKDGIFMTTDLTAPGSKLFYDIIHPLTGQPCRTGRRGWGHSKEEMDKLIADNMIYFGDTEKNVPRIKNYLGRLTTQTPKSVVFFDSQGTTKWFKDMGFDFAYPKAVSLMKYIISMYPKQDALVLDFFAGSGSTAHGIEELNKEDGGKRRWILITNNEDAGEDDGNPDTGICRDITKPRLDTVITGIAPDGSQDSDGTNSGYQYFQYDYMPRYESREANQRAFFTPTKNVDAIVRIKYGVVLKELDRDRMAMTYESNTKQIIVFLKDIDEDLMDEFFDDEHEHIVLANDIVDVDGVESETILSLVPSYEFFL